MRRGLLVDRMEHVVLVFALAAIGCSGAMSSGNTTVSGGCTSGIEYQGRTFDLEGSYQMVGVGVGTEVKAVRDVSDTMKIYFEEAANLCDLHTRGLLSAEDYVQRRASLAERFAGLARLNETAPAAEVKESDLPLYSETIAALRNSTPRAATSLRLSVTRGGAELTDGASMKSGEGFRLAVDVPTRSFLYIVLIDSHGVPSRLYPASLTGTENPVEGHVSIPKQPSAELALDQNTGTERLLVFAQAQRSTAIETMLAEVSEENTSPTEAVRGIGEALMKGVKARKALAAAGDKATRLTSALGVAALEFTIRHE